MWKVTNSKGIWITAGILLEGCLVGIFLLGNLGQRIPNFLAYFGVASIVYLAAVYWCKLVNLKTIICFGLLFRLTLLPTSPSLSDDIYRYMWDGYVQDAGINPYWYAPASDELIDFRDSKNFPRINHPEVPTIYPPLAEALFFGCYRIWPTVWTIKFVLVGFDLLTAWFLLGLLRIFDQHPGQLLIYFWNPLLLVEVASSGHVDILGVAFFVFALLYLQIGGFARMASSLALSGLSKFYAIALVPIFWRWMCAGGVKELKNRDRLLAMIGFRKAWPMLFFGGILFLGYIPYASAGEGLFRGLLIYIQHWEFNSLALDVFTEILGNQITARLVICAIFSVAVLILTLGWMHPIRAGYILTGLFLWLTPTMHPWYLIWILPFLVFYRNPAWLVFTCLSAVSYKVLVRYSVEGIWQEELWVKWVEYGGFILVWTINLGLRKFRAMRC